jgi:selenocysteine lyase/cysteine desulfurase
VTRIYLDQAATSWPKAPGVAEAVAAWYAESGVSADRGDSGGSRAVAAAVRRVRADLGRRCAVPAERVAFTSGATEGLNLLLRGLLSPGDRVVTTRAEHSSVIRPLLALGEEIGLCIEVAGCDARGQVDPDEVARLLRQGRTRLLVVTHASNVTGAVQDVAPMLAAARSEGAVSILDASQTAGLRPLDLGADCVVASAHKGLLGPPGLGFVALRPGVEPRRLRHGGSGSSRALERHPDTWPEAFEAGTPNTPAILGLEAALRWLAARGAEPAPDRATAVLDELADALAELPGFRLLPRPRGDRLPILGLTHERMDPAEIGALLDEAEVVARSGFHCAPWIHARLGTAQAGTVRLSAGPFVSADAPRRVAAALAP